MDIYPCTDDPSTWSENVSIDRLFGHLCSGRTFTHDIYMRERQLAEGWKGEPTSSSQQSESQVRTDRREPPSSLTCTTSNEDVPPSSLTKTSCQEVKSTPSGPLNEPLEVPGLDSQTERTKRHEIRYAWQFLTDRQDLSRDMRIEPLPWPCALEGDKQHQLETENDGVSADDLKIDPARIRSAYLAAKEDSYEAWSSLSLLSVGDNHTEKEIEL